MSQKRKHAEFSDIAPSNDKSFKKHRPFKPSNGQHKPRRPQVSNDISKSTSTNALKSRIRDLKRLLAHVENVEGHKMSAGMRVERERELEACEHELKEKVESSREAAYRQKMIGKYHQVRFFGEFAQAQKICLARILIMNRPSKSDTHTQATEEGAVHIRRPVSEVEPKTADT